MGEVRKGTYVSKETHDDGTMVVTQRGFTFQEETGQELAFDISEHPELGTALLFGNQVFFLRFWTDEQLNKALNELSTAIRKEQVRRIELTPTS